MLDDYSEQKLISKDPFTHIMDYSCVSLPNNVTRVKYYTMPGKHLHWFGILTLGTANLGIGIANAVIAANPQYRTHYFDSSTGKKITQKDVNERQKRRKNQERALNYYAQGNTAFEKQQWQKAQKFYELASKQMPNKQYYKQKKEIAMFLDMAEQLVKQTDVKLINTSRQQNLQQIYEQVLEDLKNAKELYLSAKNICSQINVIDRSLKTQTFQQKINDIEEKIITIEMLLQTPLQFNKTLSYSNMESQESLIQELRPHRLID